jgi:hypothetical protein
MLDNLDRYLITNMIYVPGYRATFDQVMILIGSWAHFLVRETPVIAFSWPTGPWFEFYKSL